MSRGQETDAAGDQAGGEPHGESITIDAGIEHMATRGQARCEVVRVGKELARGDGSAAGVISGAPEIATF